MDFAEGKRGEVTGRNRGKAGGEQLVLCRLHAVLKQKMTQLVAINIHVITAGWRVGAVFAIGIM
jgi:hypothetical protein